MFSSMFGKAFCQAADIAADNQVANSSDPGLVKSLVAGRTIAAAAVQPGDSCEFGSMHYFALCGVGGKIHGV